MKRRTVKQIEAENEHLREYIAASKEVASAADYAALHEEHERLRKLCRDAFENLTAGAEIHFGRCPFCGDMWPNPKGDLAAIAEIAAAHDTECERNPIRIERDALRDAVIHLGTLQLKLRRDALEVWAIRATANDLSAPFSDERVRQRLADALDGEPKL